MPYIPDATRDRARTQPENAGELTYALTALCVDYLASTDGRFADHAAVVSALECAKLEWYRRATASYEDEACARNGDVFPNRVNGPSGAP